MYIRGKGNQTNSMNPDHLALHVVQTTIYTAWKGPTSGSMPCLKLSEAHASPPCHAGSGSEPHQERPERPEGLRGPKLKGSRGRTQKHHSNPLLTQREGFFKSRPRALSPIPYHLYPQGPNPGLSTSPGLSHTGRFTVLLRGRATGLRRDPLGPGTAIVPPLGCRSPEAFGCETPRRGFMERRVRPKVGRMEEKDGKVDGELNRLIPYESHQEGTVAAGF